MEEIIAKMILLVSTKGCSVVDYCVIGYDDLSKCSEFNVLRATELISSCGNLSSMAPSSIPDHSMLTWKINFDNECVSNEYDNAKHNVKSQSVHTYVKYDLNSVPSDFLFNTEVLNDVNITINNLERGYQTQSCNDNAYKEWCSIVLNEMQTSIPSKPVFNSWCNKKRKIGKPWWNESLTILWNDLCKSESDWLKCKNPHSKSKYKQMYCNKRKFFDKEIKKAKRVYWMSVQAQLTDELNNNTNMFWY
jgi:hypothetical protein